MKTSKKQQKKQQGRGGMRGWADEPGPSSAMQEVVISESSLLNDEGEVEEVLRVDPTELLPTPSGTPAPPDDIELGSDLKPREPSPKVLRLIDEVSIFP